MRAPSTRRSFSISYTQPGPRGRAQAVRHRRQPPGPPGAPGHRLGAGQCRPDRTLLPAALCPRAQSRRIPQQRSQAGDGAPSHATGQDCAQVQPDLLHAQPATLSRQGARLLPGPYRPLCFLKSQRYLFAVRVSKAVHIALGVRADGSKEILGLWLEQNEGAKFWLRVMNELKNRGVEDVLIAIVDGLKGFPEAITAVFPQAAVQTCI